MKRSSAIALAFLAMSISFTASATPHQRYIKSILGYNYSDGTSSCFVVIGPQPPLEVVGQVIRECDGTWTSWGRTNCDDYELTQEECGASASQQQQKAEALCAVKPASEREQKGAAK
jgi:hypothetical protein